MKLFFIYVGISLFCIFAIVGYAAYQAITNRTTWTVTSINPDGSDGASFIALSYPEEHRWGGYRISFQTTSGKVTIPSPFKIRKRTEENP